MTLRAGATTDPLDVGEKTEPEVSTKRRSLSRVLIDKGMRIVTRLLLKLVPNVAYITGRSRTVLFLTRIGLKDRTERWRSAGV